MDVIFVETEYLKYISYLVNYTNHCYTYTYIYWDIVSQLLNMLETFNIYLASKNITIHYMFVLFIFPLM